MPSLIVAYSGGVDSAFLAYAATEALGPRALCVTADSPSYPDRHRQLAVSLAAQFGLHHEIIHTGELERAEYRANPANRCYYCKHELYTHLSAIARERGIAVDRRRQQRRRPRRLPARPSGRARVRHPESARRSRSDQERDSRAVAARRAADLGRAGLGVPVIAHSVLQRSHRREAARRSSVRRSVLRDLGFRVFRVRHHDAIARIELGRDEIARALEPDTADAIDRELRALGYQHVAVDLRGYRLGSLNEALRLRPV